MMDLKEGKRIDLNYKWAHGDLFPLMENAGYQVGKTMEESLGNGKRVLVICGSGNNGGDGLIAASYLSSKNNVSVIIYTRGDGTVGKLSEMALQKIHDLTVLKNPSMKELKEQVNRSEVIVDAIFGTGVHGSIREPYASIFKLINDSKSTIISVDVPSGLDTDLSIHPSATVTFTDLKEGMTVENSGKIHIKSIGIPAEEIDLAGPGEMVYFPVPEKHGHKGQNGRLLILAGWEYSGAGCMSAEAAEVSLVDLITVLVPENKQWIFSTKLNDQMVGSYNIQNMNNQLERSTAVLSGPGMGISDQSEEAVMMVVKSGKNAVFDADAIHIISRNRDIINKNMIFTPHGEEFRVLTGKEPTRENAVNFCKEHGCTIVLKGPTDIITDGTRTMTCTGGSPRMAMGGTGDILAGMIAGFLARKMDPFRAGVLGLFINKKNGENLEKISSYWFNTYDLINNLGKTMKEFYSFVSSQE